MPAEVLGGHPLAVGGVHVRRGPARHLQGGLGRARHRLPESVPTVSNMPIRLLFRQDAASMSGVSAACGGGGDGT